MATFTLSNRLNQGLIISWYVNGDNQAYTLAVGETLTFEADTLTIDTQRLITNGYLSTNAPSSPSVALAPSPTSLSPMQFLGPWVAGLLLSKGTVVTSGGQSYVVLSTHVADSGSPPNTDSTHYFFLSNTSLLQMFGVAVGDVTTGQVLARTNSGWEGTLIKDAQVDTLSQSKVTGLTAALTAKVSKAGDTMTGALVLSGDPSSGLHATSKTYVDTQITNSAALKVAKAGDTMTGALVLSGNPTLSLHATPKQYVDLRLLASANLSDIGNANTARGNLIAAKSGANSDITSLTGLTTPLSLPQGGSAATTAVGARTNFGLVPSSAQAVIYVSKSTTATDTRTGLSNYDPNKPFATLPAANAVASAGDVVRVSPGSYTNVPTTLAKNNVAMDFAPQTTVTSADRAIFDDGNVAMNIIVTGYGDFSSSEVSGGGAGVINMRHASSSIDFTARKIEVTATNETGNVAVYGSGSVKVRADLIASYTNDYCVWWVSGEWHIDARIISSTSEGSSPVFLQGGSGQNCWINANEISGTGGVGAVTMESSSSLARAWVVAKQIRTFGGTGGNAAVSSRRGRLYVQGQKILATGGAAFCNTSNNGAQLYLTFQKVEFDETNTLTTGSSWIEIGELLNSTVPNGPCIEVSGGTHHIRGMTFTAAATGLGILVSGGTLFLDNCVINTAANSSTNPITKSGGFLICRNCTFIAEATRDSISATTAQTVSLSGCWSNKALDADVTNNIAGGFTVDADLT